MAHATVGVIGHVNHGKTSLVRALTGTETDRLEEERRRGMSIVLGFAWLATPQGTVDLIDAPGHEQFIRTMVAGATGIDATLLVVNGCEGVMPQTAEHVAIADLLGVRRGAVAISRADLLSPGERAAVQGRVRDFLRGTHLEAAPVVFTSAVTGEGVPLVARQLGAFAAEARPQGAAGGRFWLPVDRVFTIAGHGTVATGTLRGAALRGGEAVACFPAGAVATVRQLQVHNRAVDAALPGQRVGVNLRHVGAAQVKRGDVLAPPGALRVSSLLDVALTLLPGVAADDVEGRPLRLLMGATDVAVTVRILSVEPGARARVLAQLRAAAPVVAVAGEACILRRDSPSATLGGGRVVDAAPRRHARGDGEAVQRLRILAGGSERQRLVEHLKSAGVAGVALSDLAAASRLPPDQLAPALQGVAFTDRHRAWSSHVVAGAGAAMLAALRAWHAAHPVRAAAPASVCRAALPAAAPESFVSALLQRLAQDGAVVRRDGQVALAGHDPLRALQPTERELLAVLESELRASGVTPPDPPPPESPARALIELLVARGEVVMVTGAAPAQRIAFHRSAIADADLRLRQAFPPPAGFTVSQARALLGSTRKFMVPLLEHLHATGHTRRRGDLHVFVPGRTYGGG